MPTLEQWTVNGRELQHRLRELESIMEALPVGVAIAHDSQCRDMVANTRLRQMLGLAPGTNPSKTGKDADQLPYRVLENGIELSPENLPLQRAARDGTVIRSRCEIVRVDGTMVVMQGRIVPLLDADGKPCGSVGMFVDVTERERLIRELQAARQEIRTLTGLLPICASCKQIRGADNRWTQVEVYVRDHYAATFTHTLCPACQHRFLQEDVG